MLIVSDDVRAVKVVKEIIKCVFVTMRCAVEVILEHQYPNTKGPLFELSSDASVPGSLSTKGYSRILPASRL